MTRLAVTGAGGQMGRAVLDAATAREDCTVALAVNRSGVTDAPVSVDDEREFPALVRERDPDVLVDFTVPEASARYVEACAEAGVPAVVGTTGFDADGRAALDAASEAIPLLHATNFSRGVFALRRAVREALAALPEYDVEVTETHHNRKRDAPSGTANTLLSDVTDVRPDASLVYGREGDQPRGANEIGVHARRAGDVTGEHEVLLAGNDEVLELTHRAGSRAVFAAGALDAATWLPDRAPGRYTFSEVLE